MQPHDHPGIAAVLAALSTAGHLDAVAGMRFLDDDVRTAAHAAAALSGEGPEVDVGAIANSLVFDADGTPLLALTSGAHRADVTLLAGHLGVSAVRRADPAFVRASTGQVIGGVAPVGHPAPLRTVVDTALARFPVVWAACGHPRAVFPTTFDGLLALTGGTALAVAGQTADTAVDTSANPR